jgi:hypothetical protein
VELYKLLKDSDPNPLAKVGTIVFKGGYDYGLASDDTRITGIEHISVVLPGETASFTIPLRDLEKIPDPPPPTFVETKTLCKIGQGGQCCRYLTAGRKGWSCEKLTTMGQTINERVKNMNAKGDNCPGKGST